MRAQICKGWARQKPPKNMKAENQIFAVHKENGEWARLDLKEGFWQYQEDIDDADTYECGYITVEEGVIVELFGCFELPQVIQDIIKRNNIKINLRVD